MYQDKFVDRHIGPRPSDIEEMLKVVGVSSLDELINETLPQSIRKDQPMKLPKALSEFEYLNSIRKTVSKNKLFKTYIGQGFYGAITPSPILRNILENPSWYTSYTPYQAEISQGRLEALLNFQTVVCELTGFELANASLLDESSAAAEAMILMFNSRKRAAVKAGANVLFVDKNIFPQTIEVLKTRAQSLNIELLIEDFNTVELNDKVFGTIIQYPAADGKVFDYKVFAEKAHECGAMVTAIADILALSIITPPSEWGADIATGTTQRFGIPMGFGGPSAAYFATKNDYLRKVPGRIIGVSKDAHGNRALRMTLQTREQHIKREKATSNICTAQALLANMAGMYAVYHGKEGLQGIAKRISSLATLLSEELVKLGCTQENVDFFDTLKVQLPAGVAIEDLRSAALKEEINLRYFDGFVGISIDETTSVDDINNLIKLFSTVLGKGDAFDVVTFDEKLGFDSKFLRQSDYMKFDLFSAYRSETELMRYIKKLERKDFSLTNTMIPLGSCTMKLNAASELLPLSWAELGGLHPFVPADQAQGYYDIINELEDMLKEITGFAAVSFQPNSGASGEYAGLLCIRNYQKSVGEGHRDIVLIPSSAHGTNPASAIAAGCKVVVVACDENGNIDVEDLRAKSQEHKDNLSAFMITYPSTHGVFESQVIEMMNIIHDNGGQVYMDGANMNAQVGLTSPGLIGADVCHLNLHKTFAIPHGGGGPGVGPIGVAEHLKPFLPNHCEVETGGENGMAVSAAPFGSAYVLVISHAYIKMLGSEGLTNSTKIAILNANYLMAKLKDTYGIVYSGETGRVGHEMILECRNFKKSHVDVSDIAKRLMDFGFHAPTLSFPVHGTLMVEPTESESKYELDRFVEAMDAIYKEIQDLENEEADHENNILKNAPHTEATVISSEWNNSYSREAAAYPSQAARESKFWPTVGRIDDAFGDRNVQCCIPLTEAE